METGRGLLNGFLTVHTYGSFGERGRLSRQNATSRMFAPTGKNCIESSFIRAGLPCIGMYSIERRPVRLLVTIAAFVESTASVMTSESCTRQGGQ